MQKCDSKGEKYSMNWLVVAKDWQEAARMAAKV